MRANSSFRFVEISEKAIENNLHIRQPSLTNSHVMQHDQKCLQCIFNVVEKINICSKVNQQSKQIAYSIPSNDSIYHHKKSGKYPT